MDSTCGILQSLENYSLSNEKAGVRVKLEHRWALDISIITADEAYFRAFCIVRSVFQCVLESSGTVTYNTLKYRKKYLKRTKIHQISDNYRYIKRPPMGIARACAGAQAREQVSERPHA